MLSNTSHKLTIDSNSKLAIATRTNTPIVSAPSEFQPEIIKTATKYINLYARRYTDKDVCGMMELLPIVRNRFENLTVEGIANGSIKCPADINGLLKGNAIMQPLEERAIVEAFHNGVKNASLYIYLFFSFKVYDFMKNSKLIGMNNEQDMYSSLQTYLYDIVSNFDFNRIENGGLSTSYYRQSMCDYVREVLIGKNYSLFSLNRRQVADLHKAQRITEEDSRKLSYEEISKKYDIAKVAVSLHFIIRNTIQLDDVIKSENGITTNNHEFITDNKNVFEEVEVPVKYKQMIVMLKKDCIEESVTKSVLSALLSYTEQSRAEKGYIKKASQRVYKNIANEVGVPMSVVETVIESFGELFV